jgi:hypothetical protein
VGEENKEYMVGLNMEFMAERWTVYFRIHLDLEQEGATGLLDCKARRSMRSTSPRIYRQYLSPIGCGVNALHT